MAAAAAASSVARTPPGRKLIGQKVVSDSIFVLYIDYVLFVDKIKVMHVNKC